MKKMTQREFDDARADGMEFCPECESFIDPPQYEDVEICPSCQGNKGEMMSANMALNNKFILIVKEPPKGWPIEPVKRGAR